MSFSNILYWRMGLRMITKNPEPCFNINRVFPGMGISITKIRRSHDRLIFIMGIPIPGKTTSLYWDRLIFMVGILVSLHTILRPPLGTTDLVRSLQKQAICALFIIKLLVQIANCRYHCLQSPKTTHRQNTNLVNLHDHRLWLNPFHL